MSQHGDSSNASPLENILLRIDQHLSALKLQCSSALIPMDTRDASNMDVDEDSFVVKQAPTTLLTPYSALLAVLSVMEQDFFRTTMDDDLRRSFLHECPRNTARQYQPPPLNDINVGPHTQRVDKQLRDIQYRLSGLTRPIDLFVHDTVRSNLMDPATALRFANRIHMLLSDVASFITQIRSDNICCDTRLATVPIATQVLPNLPLLDAENALEHTNLQQALHKATRQQRPTRRRKCGPQMDNNQHAPGENLGGNSSTSATAGSGDQQHKAGFQQHKKFPNWHKLANNSTML